MLRGVFMVEILKMRLDEYKSYFKDYEGILETLEDLKDSNKDSFLYVLEYISNLLYYLEKCDSELEIQDVVTEEDFDYSEYDDETEEETSFEIDDGEEYFDYSEYSDETEEDFDYSEYSDETEEDFDFSEYNDETEEDFDFSEYNDETEEDFDYSEYNDDTEEDFDFSEYEDTDGDDEVDTELYKGTITEKKGIFDTPYRKGERSGYNKKVDFSSDTGDYDFSAYGSETDEFDYNLYNGSGGYGDKQSNNIGLKNEGKGYIDTSEFENIEFPDFDLKDYQQSKVYSDDLADKMADTLKKLSDGAKKFFTDKNKPKK